MIGTINGLHVVRECDGFTSAVVLDPALGGVFFASANVSEGLARTTKEVKGLFGSLFKNMVRRPNGDKVIAIVVFLGDGGVVELHPTAHAAEKAYEAYVGTSA